EDFNIYFNYDPQSAYTDQNGVRHNEPNFTKIPPVKTLIGPIAHILILLPLGIYLYARSVNERNGNYLLYPKLQKVVLACAIFFGGIIGGLILSHEQSLSSFYIGFLVTSFITYFLLPKILKWKVSWNFK
ncbi:ABC transporter permease, partial [Bacillus sp. HC-Mk]